MFDFNFSGQESLKQAIGQAIIDKIQERTQEQGRSGLLSGSSKKGYSAAYKKSLDFRAAGKSNKVNMTLTGDMLELMDINQTNNNSVTIGWSDREEQLKASNNIVGDTVPKRDFFGLTRDDIRDIKDDFQADIDAIKERRGSRRAELIAALASRFLTDDNDGES